MRIFVCISLFTALTFFGFSPKLAASQQICRSALHRAVEVWHSMLPSLAPAGLSYSDPALELLTAPEPPKPSPVRSFAQQREELLERIEYLNETHQRALTGPEPSDPRLINARLLARATISRILTRAGQAPYHWTAMRDMLQRHQDLAREAGLQNTADIHFGIKYLLYVESQAKGRGLSSPLREELRSRYERMREGTMDWPTDPTARAILDLPSQFQEVPSHRPEAVEEYLDYEELRSLGHILEYLETRLALEGIGI